MKNKKVNSYDYSNMSKVIIDYILSFDKNSDEFDVLTDKQKNTLNTELPMELQDPEGIVKDVNSLLTKNDELYKVNYNQSSKWFAPLGWQKALTTMLSELGYRIDNALMPEENFKDYFRKSGKEGLKKYLESLFNTITEVDKFIIISKGIKSIKTYDTSNLNFDYLEVNSDIITNSNKSTWIVNVDDIPLIQIQSGAGGRANGHIARINLNELENFYKKQIVTNETWGISVEVAICKFWNVSIPPEYVGRFDNNMVLDAQSAISKNATKLNIPKMTSCKGAERKGQKKSPVDFMAGNKTVSVKTNYNGNYKVCPPEIGQPGLKEGLAFYNSLFDIKITEAEFKNNNLVFKQQFQKHINKIVEKQVEKLFSEDYILYMRKTSSKGIEMDFLDTSSKNYIFDKTKFSFTQTPENWNESVSISYDGVSLAEMQLHSKRWFKFRFTFKNLLAIINGM